MTGRHHHRRASRGSGPRRLAERRTAGLLAGIASAAVALAGCSTAPYALQPGRSTATFAPTSTVGFAPSAAAIPPPSPSPSPSPSYVVGRDWQRLELPAGIPHAELTAVTADAHGWIAVGRGGLPPNEFAVVLTSPDGRRWTAADRSGFGVGEASFVGVASTGSVRAVIATTVDGSSKAWQSGSGGRWAPVTLPDWRVGGVDGLVAGHGRFVAVGGLYYGTPRAVGAIWSSNDGLRWYRTTFSASHWPLSIATTPEGFLALGGIPQPSGESRPALWTSADGLAWAGPTLLPVESDGLHLAAGPGGIVIPGPVGTGASPGDWISADGKTWTKEILPGALALDAVAPLGTGFFASARDPSGGLDSILMRPSLDVPWEVEDTTLGPSGIGSLPGLAGIASSPDGTRVVAVGGTPAIFVSPSFSSGGTR